MEQKHEEPKKQDYEHPKEQDQTQRTNQPPTKMRVVNKYDREY